MPEEFSEINNPDLELCSYYQFSVPGVEIKGSKF